MSQPARSAFSSHSDTATAAREVAETLAGLDARVVVFFHSPQHDGRVVAETLAARLPQAHVIGASSCGEFSDRHHARGGVVALALDGSRVARSAVTLMSVEGELSATVEAASLQLAAQLGTSLRELDPQRHVGLLLVDSSRRREEDVNEALGNAAPLLSFVGGSAGDDMRFEHTWVHTATRSSEAAAVLLVMELKTPFHILKRCNYEPTERAFTVTRAEPAARLIWELDGRPAAEVYSETVDLPVSQLTPERCLFHPLGQIIQGRPWLRSVICAEPGGGLRLACRIEQGTRVRLMRGHDIVADTRQAFDGLEQALGAPPVAGLMFHCVGRMLEVQVTGVEAPYYSLFQGFPVAGAHLHGESWLGHINQTLTGLVIA